MRISPSIAMLVAAGAAGMGSVSMLPLSRGGSVTVVDPAYHVELVSRTGYRMPDGLLWQPDGIYFADEGAGLLQKLVPGGVQRLHFPRPAIGSPKEVATNGTGDFYFTDGKAANVWHWRAAGGLRLLAGQDQGMRSSEGIALSPSGEIFAGDRVLHRIVKIFPDGRTQTYATRIASPGTLAFDPSGGLYVGDSEERKLYYLSNGRARVALNDEQTVPDSIAWYEGGLLVADGVHGRLSRWRPGAAPEAIAAFGGNLRRLVGVTADDQGNIWISAQTSVCAKKGYIFKLARAPRVTSR